MKLDSTLLRKGQYQVKYKAQLFLYLGVVKKIKLIIIIYESVNKNKKSLTEYFVYDINFFS